MDFWAENLGTAAMVIGAAFGLYLLFWLCFKGVLWVNDSKRKIYQILGSKDDDLVFNVVCPSFVIAAILILIWPFVIPLMVLFASVFALRSIIRFKKKITRAINSKSDYGHDHPESEPEQIEYVATTQKIEDKFAKYHTHD